MLHSRVRRGLLGLTFVGINVLAFAAATSVHAQSISLDPSSVSVQPPPPVGPCAPTGFSPDGDIFDAVQSLPLGPPGCGLGWPGPLSPANLDAFSSGKSVFFFGGALPLPTPPGVATMLFSVNERSTGDTFSSCTTARPGGLPPDVGTESCSIEVHNAPPKKTTDAPADIYATSPNTAPLGLGPAPGSMLPHYQFQDGDGNRSFVCPFPPAPGGGRLEPVFPANASDPIDDVDAYDFSGPASGFFAFDVAPADGVGDVPLYYSVDPPTAAAGGFLPDDVIVAIAGAAAVYAPGALLGLGAGNDVDGLTVFDVGFDGVYAPGAGDRILYSLSAASAAINTADCHGVKINAGDVLVEGTPLGFPGVPCIVIDAREIGLWKASTCGPNPANGDTGGDELDAFDIVGAFVAPPAVCGPTPLPDGSCKLADVSGLGKSSLTIKSVTPPDRKNQVNYKWSKGVATTVGDFHDPTDATPFTYRLCIYDGSALPQPIYQKDIADNSVIPLCFGKPCWKATGSGPTGYKYNNSKQPGKSGGVKGMSLKSNATPGKSKVSIKVLDRFSTPPSTAPITGPVVVQLLITDGGTTECFKTTFTAAPTKQTPTDYKVKGP